MGAVEKSPKSQKPIWAQVQPAGDIVEKGEGLNSYHTYPFGCTLVASNRINLARNGAENL